MKFNELKVGMKIINTLGMGGRFHQCRVWEVRYIGDTIAVVSNDGSEKFLTAVELNFGSDQYQEIKPPEITKKYCNVYKHGHIVLSRDTLEESKLLHSRAKDCYKYTLEITETDGKPEVKVLYHDKV
jgi:hypothetical protein